MPSACSASTRLGLTRSARAAAASTSLAAVTSTATVPARSWTSSIKWRWAPSATPGGTLPLIATKVPVPIACGDRRHDVAQLGVAQRRSRFVDHGGTAVRFDQHGRATQLATHRHGRDVEPLGFEQVGGNGAEPAGERADEASRRAQGHGGPADVHRLATRRDHRIRGTEHLTGRQRGELERPVDRLVEADDEHQTRLPPW